MIETAIFDLDGTLLNTLGDLTAGVNYAMEKHAFPTRTIEEVRDFIGNGIGVLIKRAMPEGCTEQLHAECLSDFRKYYEENMKDKTVPYDGIIEMLQAVRQKGINIAILSNKHDPAAKDLVKHYFPNMCDLVFGERPNVPRKPDPDSALEILEHFNTKKENAIYIGDSGVDMDTAKNAGLYSVGVSWGFRSVEILKEHGACKIIDKPSELLELL